MDFNLIWLMFLLEEEIWIYREILGMCVYREKVI